MNFKNDVEAVDALKVRYEAFLNEINYYSVWCEND